jgi:uncharacterized protein (DUF983 family)
MGVLLMSKRRSVCPCCDAPQNATLIPFYKKDQRNCYRCGAALKRISTESAPVKVLLIILSLVPSTAIGLSSVPMFKAGHGLMWLGFALLWVIYTWSLDWIQFPYTNTFVEVVEQPAPDPNALHPPTSPTQTPI